MAETARDLAYEQTKQADHLPELKEKPRESLLGRAAGPVLVSQGGEGLVRGKKHQAQCIVRREDKENREV